MENTYMHLLCYQIQKILDTKRSSLVSVTFPISYSTALAWDSELLKTGLLKATTS